MTAVKSDNRHKTSFWNATTDNLSGFMQRKVLMTTWQVMMLPTENECKLMLCHFAEMLWCKNAVNVRFKLNGSFTQDCRGISIDKDQEFLAGVTDCPALRAQKLR